MMADQLASGNLDEVALGREKNKAAGLEYQLSLTCQKH
jgi:hypothetical protein